jgi:hypothetical protein
MQISRFDYFMGCAIQGFITRGCNLNDNLMSASYNCAVEAINYIDEQNKLNMNESEIPLSYKDVKMS